VIRTGVNVFRRSVAREAAGVVKLGLLLTLLHSVRLTPRRTVTVLAACTTPPTTACIPSRRRVTSC